METSRPPSSLSKPAGWRRAALVTGLLAGTLDIAAACTQYALATHKSPVNVLKFVASGAFGNAAFAGGAGMAAAGLGFHYAIALFFAVAFYWLCPRIPGLGRHPWLTGLLYGIAVWLVMNLLVVPLSLTPKSPFKPLSAAVGLGIIVLCIGLPIGLRAARYYARKNHERRPV